MAEPDGESGRNEQTQSDAKRGRRDMAAVSLVSFLPYALCDGSPAFAGKTLINGWSQHLGGDAGAAG